MTRRTLLEGIALLMLAGPALTASAGIVPETLQDGTKIEIDGENVYAIRTGDGSVKPAGGALRKVQRSALADGSYRLKSGKTIQVKNGKLVAQK